jgi:hypothetical protein
LKRLDAGLRAPCLIAAHPPAHMLAADAPAAVAIADSS